MLLIALPARPGTDLASKLLLQDSKMKHMIIAEVVGKGINSDAYYVGSCDRHDGRKTDVLYLPHCTPTNDLPPVIVEIQQKVNYPFIARAIRYCLDVFEETHIVPILVVFNVKGFSEQQFFNKIFKIADNQCFYTLHYHSWAKFVYIYNADSIAKQMSKLFNVFDEIIIIITRV